MKTRITLYAEEDMVLTDGKTYCKEVNLAVGADASLWREILKSEVPCDEVTV